MAELYTKVSTFLDPLDATIVTDKVKEGMKQHISQLKKKEYYLLVAGKWVKMTAAGFLRKTQNSKPMSHPPNPRFKIPL